MKNIMIMLFASFLGLALVTVDAEARRLGGGRSLGRSAPAYKKPAAPRSTPQQQRQDTQQLNRSRQTSGASRWLGPLAGLVAGGLLASLLFGDAFEGFQFMDFLLIAALIFGAVMLFKALRSRSPTPASRSTPAPAGLPSAPVRPPSATLSDTPSRIEVPEIGSGLKNIEESEQWPNWFNEETFLQAAKTHFIRLQAAWDVGDMKDIREYTTPELFAELTLERQSYGGEQAFTEVLNLDAELLGLAIEDDRIVVGVRYSGMIREEQGAEAHSFSEVWHIQHDRHDPRADWYVAGIEQQH